MTNASEDIIEKSLNDKGYQISEEYSPNSHLFRNNSMIGVVLEKVNEDNFDLYQAKRRREKDFLGNPKSHLFSDIENSLMEIDEEFLMEEEKLKEPLEDRETIEARVKEDLMKIANDLKNAGYKTDFYEFKEGWDI